jgi:hypothetical protein
MIEVEEGILFSEELFERKFVCDLSACKGACCVEGESGAPLTQEETVRINELLPKILPYLNEQGRRTIEENGVSTVDMDGELVTTIVGGVAECAFTIFEKDGTAKCGIERAWNDGVIDFRKPSSCHLYPIRLQKMSNGGVALNYHHWPICAPACACGEKLNVPAFKFLKEAIEKEFGEEFYQKLLIIHGEWEKQRDR